MRVQAPAGGVSARAAAEDDVPAVVEAPRRPALAVPVTRRRQPTLPPRLAVLAADAACLAAALAIVGDDVRSAWQAAAAAGIWLVAFAAFALDAPRRLDAPAEARRIVAAAAVGGCGLALTASTTPGTVAAVLACALALELTWRGVFRVVRERRRALGRASRRALLVCEADDTEVLIGELGGRFTAAGRLDPDAVDEAGRELRAAGAEAIVVHGRSLSTEATRRLLRSGRREGVDVCIVTDLPGVFGGYAVAGAGERLVATVAPPAFPRTRWALKRAADIAAAGILLVLLAPLMAAIALAIRCTTRRPALYRQLRVTRDGRVFAMVKFRTMTDAAVAAVDDRAFAKLAADDPRITPLGRRLRRSSLDELPQLWNVLRGDMSLIGPRPLQLEQVSANRALLEPRLAVPGGLSGWWQVNGRSDTDPEAAVQLDMYYIDNWSLGLDLYILVRTFGAVLFGRGAF
jgi:exopolysaccharide biosynthesis polyprenyl glycosylphosphotransferase